MVFGLETQEFGLYFPSGQVPTNQSPGASGGARGGFAFFCSRARSLDMMTFSPSKFFYKFL